MVRDVYSKEKINKTAILKKWTEFTNVTKTEILSFR